MSTTNGATTPTLSTGTTHPAGAPAPAAGTPPQATAGAGGAASDPATELATLKAQLASLQAEKDALAKKEADAQLTAAERRQKAEKELADKVAELDRRTWLADLRDAGIPSELAQFLAVPDGAQRAEALKQAKTAYMTSIEAAKKAAASPQGSLPSAPISPLSISGQPAPSQSQAIASKFDAITADMVKRSRSLK